MSRSSWRENDRIRTGCVANLVEAARRNGISRFVQESFALTYPDRADAWIDEQTPIDPAAYSKTVSDASSLLYVATILAQRLDSANRSLLELKRQIQAGEPGGVIGRTVERIEGLLGETGVNLMYAGYPYDPFADAPKS